MSYIWRRSTAVNDEGLGVYIRLSYEVEEIRFRRMTMQCEVVVDSSWIRGRMHLRRARSRIELF
jgi:hypothetical protein